MQLRHFVSGSALLLSAWLVVTFFHKVPTQRYVRPENRPVAKLNESPSPALPGVSGEAGPKEVLLQEAGIDDSEFVRVSNSQ
jgi:hypothetical protein